MKHMLFKVKYILEQGFIGFRDEFGYMIITLFNQ